jgi:hypothetical protein
MRNRTVAAAKPHYQPLTMTATLALLSLATQIVVLWYLFF